MLFCDNTPLPVLKDDTLHVLLLQRGFEEDEGLELLLSRRGSAHGGTLCSSNARVEVHVEQQVVVIVVVFLNKGG